MRKIWPLAAVLMLGMTAATDAQFTVNGARITNGANTNAAASGVPTFGLTQMMPQFNAQRMVASPLGARTAVPSFSFTKMMPNFSWLRTKLWPIAGPTSQTSSSMFGSPLKVR